MSLLFNTFDDNLFSKTTKKTNLKIRLECSFCNSHFKHAMIIAKEINDKDKIADVTKLTGNGKDLIFCDLICARLYDLNVHKICYDAKQYREDYLNSKLSKTGILIYEKCANKLFSQLPILIINSDNEEIEKKKIKRMFISCL